MAVIAPDDPDAPPPPRVPSSPERGSGSRVASLGRFPDAPDAGLGRRAGGALTRSVDIINRSVGGFGANAAVLVSGLFLDPRVAGRACARFVPEPERGFVVDEEPPNRLMIGADAVRIRGRDPSARYPFLLFRYAWIAFWQPGESFDMFLSKQA